MSRRARTVRRRGCCVVPVDESQDDAPLKRGPLLYVRILYDRATRCRCRTPSVIALHRLSLIPHRSSLLFIFLSSALAHTHVHKPWRPHKAPHEEEKKPVPSTGQKRYCSQPHRLLKTLSISLRSPPPAAWTAVFAAPGHVTIRHARPRIRLHPLRYSKFSDECAGRTRLCCPGDVARVLAWASRAGQGAASTASAGERFVSRWPFKRSVLSGPTKLLPHSVGVNALDLAVFDFGCRRPAGQRSSWTAEHGGSPDVRREWLACRRRGRLGLAVVAERIGGRPRTVVAGEHVDKPQPAAGADHVPIRRRPASPTTAIRPPEVDT